MKNLTYEQVLHRLAAYCSRAERCISNIRKKMESWEIPYEEQNRVIDHLQKENFLDESRFCRAFVNDKTRFSRWGTLKIRFELKKKRLPDNLIEDALAEIKPENTLERLRRLIEQKRKTVKGNSEFEIKQKLMRFAASRGFSFDEIEKVI